MTQLPISPESPDPAPPVSPMGSGRMPLWQIGLLLVPLLTAALLVTVTIRHFRLNELYFTYSTYYVLWAIAALYIGVQISGQGQLTPPRQWLRDNYVGLVLTAFITLVVVLAVAPAYRVLSDETNLVGVSKNLYFQRTANFATTGKWYFDNYWNLDQTIDRRPALFPFLVCLLHTVRGYHPENAFHVNAVIFALLAFTSYKLGKKLGGELLGVSAAILVATHPNTMVAARSAGFDLLSSLMILIVIKSLIDYSYERSPKQLAILSLNLCILAHVRYEGWALLLVAGAVLITFRMVSWQQIREYRALYALIPILLLPRYWQAVAKAHDAEQPISAALFSVSNFIQNAREYVRLVAHPLDVGGPHAPLLLLLGFGGLGLFLFGLSENLRAKRLSRPTIQGLVFVVAILGVETIIAFSYNWGKTLHPASARLFIWLDTFLAFNAAWLLVAIGRRFAPLVPLLQRRSGMPFTFLTSLALFGIHVPAASEARFINALILTRQASRTWDFFSKLGKKNILIMADRPGLYTIMNYGALDISLAKQSRDPLTELSRHLYEDVYLIQEVDLTTHKPLPAFDVWEDTQLETALEFQNTDSTSTRIARVKH